MKKDDHIGQTEIRSNVKQCSKGHFYDSSKYVSCPHCAEGDLEESDQSVTVSYSRIIPTNKSENYSVSNEEITIAKYSKNMGTECVVGWLVCTEGAEYGRDYRLFHGRNKVGRNFSMDVIINDDPAISRDTHAQIIYDSRDNSFYAFGDKGNLIYINGVLKNNPERIYSGDKIKIGDTTLVFIAFCEGERKW